MKRRAAASEDCVVTVRASLLLTPAPVKLESPVGYLSRLAEVNRIRVDALVAHAMLRPEYVPTVGWDYTKLSPILGDCTLPEGFGYRIPRGAKGMCQINGHVTPTHDLDVVKARVCPDCVRLLGRIPIVWDLRGYVACHVHRRLMLKWCPGCKRRITARRSGLLTCSCGYNFSSSPVEAASPELVAISELLWAKVTGDKAVTRTATALGIPVSDLLELDLDLMCRLFVRLAGALTTLACGSRVRGRDLRVVPYLAEIGKLFSNWPINLKSFCSRWTEFSLARPRHQDTFQWAFYWLFYALCKNAKERKHQFAFFAEQVLAYGRREWREKPVLVRDPVLNARLPPQRYISLLSAASTLGLSRSGTRWFKKGRLAWTIVGKDRKGKPVVDVELLRQVKLSKFPLREARSVSRTLGVPHKVLRVLRQNGQIRTEHLTTVEGSLSVEDIAAFENDVCKNALTVKSARSLFRLSDYLYSSWPTVEEKCSLLASIRTGTTKVYCLRKPSIRYLLLGADLLAAAKRSRRERWIPSLLAHTKRTYGSLDREAKATLSWLGLAYDAEVDARSKRKLERFFSGHIRVSALAREQGLAFGVLYPRLPKRSVVVLRARDAADSYVAVYLKSGALPKVREWCVKFRRDKVSQSRLQTSSRRAREMRG